MADRAYDSALADLLVQSPGYALWGKNKMHWSRINPLTLVAVPRQLFAFAHSAYNPYAIHKRYANLPMVPVFNNPQRRQLLYSGYQSVCTLFFLY
jgi:hypothetical protein